MLEFYKMNDSKKINNVNIIKKESPRIDNIAINDLEKEITSLTKYMSPSVVNIVISKDVTLYKRNPFWFFNRPVWTVNKKVWWWTGFFINKNGVIITNKHVVNDVNASYTVITNDWIEYEAEVLVKHSFKDIAVIKILNSDWTNVSTSPLKIVDTQENIKIWQFAIAIGNALSKFQNSVTLWVISWKDRTIWSKSDEITWLLQTDASINPWNSWGPLINLKWEVVWINTAIITSANTLGFAIPITKNDIDNILDSLDN